VAGDFLTRLVDRARGEALLVRPRPAPLFAPEPFVADGPDPARPASELPAGNATRPASPAAEPPVPVPPTRMEAPPPRFEEAARASPGPPAVAPAPAPAERAEVPRAAEPATGSAGQWERHRGASAREDGAAVLPALAVSRPVGPGPAGGVDGVVVAATPRPPAPFERKPRPVVPSGAAPVDVAPRPLPARSRARGRDRDPEEAPVVRVSIGRVEVRATAPPPPPEPRRVAASGGLVGLDDYLRGAHRRGGRG
jgi:hypothetical protein